MVPSRQQTAWSLWLLVEVSYLQLIRYEEKQSPDVKVVRTTRARKARLSITPAGAVV